MRAIVAYESIYGNTRAIADAVAAGLRGTYDVEVVSVNDQPEHSVDDADLLVVGGPTHMHGLATATSISKRSGHDQRAAAFDTRLDHPTALTGAASRGIARRLRRRGFQLLEDPESFLVADSEGPLVEGELDRARAWGASLSREAAK